MTAQEVLEEIRMLGGSLEVRGDRLRVDAPVGTITPDIKAALTRHKAAIVAELSTPDPVGSQFVRTRCSACGRLTYFLEGITGCPWIGCNGSLVEIQPRQYLDTREKRFPFGRIA
jgi:hypothetical protein